MDNIEDLDSGTELLLVSQMPWLEVPLDAKKACIRLLKLHRGSDDEPIICDLQVVSLDDKPEFGALSYVWGDGTKIVPITVGGQILQVTQNLMEFLHCLRHPARDHFLWADAICINQSSIEEKNHQLGLMSRIYREAKETHIWFGHFTTSWPDDIVYESYISISKMTPAMWHQVESYCRRMELPEYLKAGGIPRHHNELPDPKKQTIEMIMTQALEVLDQFAHGKHFHQFPLFCTREEAGPLSPDRPVALNRYWVVLMDCVRWLTSRPWWSRVWTLQEAILSNNNAMVHIGPHPVPLSRISRGVHAMMEHCLNCCKKFTNSGMANYQKFPIGQFITVYHIDDFRKRFKNSDEPFLSIHEAIEATKYRKATDVRDHFFGILGLLPDECQEYFQGIGYSMGSAETFAQASKLLYASNSHCLGMLAEARGVRPSLIPDLPSWAWDLSDEREEDKDETEEHWRCYNAASGTKHTNLLYASELAGETLTVSGTRISIISAPGPRTTLDDLRSSSGTTPGITKVIMACHDLYQAHHDKASSSDPFWRAIFMDRNIWRNWRHRRVPLPAPRLHDIRQWWTHLRRTGETHDLHRDRQSALERPGTYHYRAVEMNLQQNRFFVTAECGGPGLGPHDIQADDEIHIIQGCPAPAVLRRVTVNDEARLVFVGLCFVDGSMYGEALRGKDVEWKTLDLY